MLFRSDSWATTTDTMEAFHTALTLPNNMGIGLKQGGNSKGAMERSRASSSGGQNDDRGRELGARSEEKSTSAIENSKDFESNQRASMKFRNTRHDGQDKNFEKKGDTKVSGSQATKNSVRSDGIRLTDIIA